MLERLGLTADAFALVTLHRPSNVDEPETLRGILEALRDVASEVPVLFPAHPRTVKMMRAHNLDALVDVDGGVGKPGAIAVVEPVGYVDFLRLMADARGVLTDSGGIQEETTYLGIPCLTVRDTTERPITVSQGTNRLVQPADVDRYLPPDFETRLQYAWAATVWRHLVPGSPQSAFSPSMRVTISAGVTMLRPDDTEDSFLARADNALYEAKARGRNRVATA